MTCGDWDLKRMLPIQLGLLGLEMPIHYTKWCNKNM